MRKRKSNSRKFVLVLRLQLPLDSGGCAFLNRNEKKNCVHTTRCLIQYIVL